MRTSSLLLALAGSAAVLAARPPPGDGAGRDNAVLAPAKRSLPAVFDTYQKRDDGNVLLRRNDHLEESQAELGQEKRGVPNPYTNNVQIKRVVLGGKGELWDEKVDEKRGVPNPYTNNVQIKRNDHLEGSQAELGREKRGVPNPYTNNVQIKRNDHLEGSQAELGREKRGVPNPYTNNVQIKRRVLGGKGELWGEELDEKRGV